MHGPDQRDRAGAYPQVVQVLGLGEGSGALETRVVAGSAVYTPISGARADGVAGAEVDARQDAAGLEVDPERAAAERVLIHRRVDEQVVVEGKLHRPPDRLEGDAGQLAGRPGAEDAAGGRDVAGDERRTRDERPVDHALVFFWRGCH